MDEDNVTLEEPLNKNFREPKIRFPEFKESWNYKSLSDFASKLNRKNKNNQSDLVLTISAQYGLIDQKEFFNKNVSGSNIENYYLLNNGDFAYNRSYSKDYPYGAIKRLDNYESGVVSTLYIVFEPKSNVNSDYLKYYFETDKWNNQISLISGEGARNHGLLNLSPSDFFQTKHWIPALDEQVKISLFLEKIFSITSVVESKLETLKKYKEGFVNNWFSNKDNMVQLKNLVNQKPSPLLKSHFKENSGQYPVYEASGHPYTTINFYNNGQDSVAIIKYGSGCGKTFLTYGKHNVLGTMSELIPKDKELLEYIYAYTLSKQFRRICTRYTEIGTTPNLYYSDYSEEYVYIPKDKDKTKKFIEIFTNLEKEESICQKKLIILGQIKSHLLKSMFI